MKVNPGLHVPAVLSLRNESLRGSWLGGPRNGEVVLLGIGFGAKPAGAFLKRGVHLSACFVSETTQRIYIKLGRFF